MSIRVECDQCFQTYDVPDDKVGRRMKCRDCGNVLVIRESAASAGPPPAVLGGSGGGSSTGKKKRSKSKSSESSAPIGLMVGGLLVVIALGVTAFVARGFLPAAADNANAQVAASDEGTGSPADAIETPEESAPTADVGPTDSAVNSNPAADSAPPTSNAGASNLSVTPPPSKQTEPTKPAWSLATAPAPELPTWPERFRWDISFPDKGEKMLYPASPSTCVAVGLTGNNASQAVVYDLIDSKRVGRMQAKLEPYWKVALSPDGKLIANGRLSDKGLVEVWSTESGELVNALQMTDTGQQLTFLDFARSDRLVAGSYSKREAKQKQRLVVVEPTSGDVVSDQLTGEKIEHERHVYRHDGRYLISFNTGNTLTAFDLEEGTFAGEMEGPKTSEAGDSMTATDIAFSPDGERLVLLQTTTWSTELSILSAANGELEQSISLPGAIRNLAPNSVLYEGRDLQVTEDLDYALICGQLLVHLPSARIVWSLDILPTEDDYKLTNNSARKLLGHTIAIADGPPQSQHMEPMRLPLDKVSDAVASLSEDGSALLAPQGSVKISVEIASVRFGDSDETKEELRQILEDRLASEGFAIAEEAPCEFILEYAEGQGKDLRLRTMGRIPGGSPPASSDGKVIQSTQAVAQLYLKAGKKDLWSRRLEIDPRVLFIKGDATAESARKSVFDQVTRTIYGIPLVWYVSGAKPPVVLPVQEELQTISRLSGVRPRPRPRRR